MVDSIIKLFDSSATEFNTNGLGFLPDAITCTVSEEMNGEFELQMTYPITGKKYSNISLRQIIVSKSNPYSEPQAFRIYSISRPINGIVTINAEHISYDLTGYPVTYFTASNATTAFTNLKKASVLTCPFTFYTDISKNGDLSVDKPTSMRSVLGSSDGSILDAYGGEYEFDNYKVNLWNHRGKNRGVSIRYGKNLTDLEQEENCSNVYTGVYPFWYSESDDNLVQLSNKILNASGTYDFTRIYVLDLSSELNDEPTEAELKEVATEWMEENDIGVPSVSLKISFIQLSQSEEYKNYTLLETVRLGDTVNVEFPELNVSATSQCIKTTYNALTDKYEEIELGDATSNLASTIISQNEATNKTAEQTKTNLEKEIERATALITGGLGGHVIIQSSTGGGYPDEILIMDTDNIKTAQKVWRWNKGGLGYSNTGYNGPYETAITSDGHIVANFVDVGELNGNIIKAGTISADLLDVEYKKSVTSEISSMGSQAEKNANDATDEKLKNYSSKSEVTTAISNANNQVLLSVNSTYETKENVSSKISDAKTDINSTTDTKLKNYYTQKEVDSKISVSEDGITAEYTKALKNYTTTADLKKGYYTQTQVNSKITASEKGITSSFTETLSNYAKTSTVTSMKSSISQNAKNIKLRVQTSKVVTTLNSKLSSSITLKSNSLAMKTNAFSLSSDYFSMKNGELIARQGTRDNNQYVMLKNGSVTGGVYSDGSKYQIAEIAFSKYIVNGTGTGLTIRTKRNMCISTPALYVANKYEQSGLTRRKGYTGSVSIKYVSSIVFTSTNIGGKDGASYKGGTTVLSGASLGYNTRTLHFMHGILYSAN